MWPENCFSKGDLASNLLWTGSENENTEKYIYPVAHKLINNSLKHLTVFHKNNNCKDFKTLLECYQNVADRLRGQWATTESGKMAGACAVQEAV